MKEKLKAEEMKTQLKQKTVGLVLLKMLCRMKVKCEGRQRENSTANFKIRKWSIWRC